MELQTPKKIKSILISISVLFSVLFLIVVGILTAETGILEDIGDLFGSNTIRVSSSEGVTTKVNGQIVDNNSTIKIDSQNKLKYLNKNTNLNDNVQDFQGNSRNDNSNQGDKSFRVGVFGPKIKVKSSLAKNMKFQNYDNCLFSMKIPQGWKVRIGAPDHTHYTFFGLQSK